MNLNTTITYSSYEWYNIHFSRNSCYIILKWFTNDAKLLFATLASFQNNTIKEIALPGSQVVVKIVQMPSWGFFYYFQCVQQVKCDPPNRPFKSFNINLPFFRSCSLLCHAAERRSDRCALPISSHRNLWYLFVEANGFEKFILYH